MTDDSDDADDVPSQEPATGESVTLTVDGAEYRGRLNTPESGSDHGILVVPGAGHGPFGTVFATFADAAEDAGYTVARFETWADHDALEAKTPADHRAELAAGIDFLREQGCETVCVVAKSFGGRLALQYGPLSADRMVLWAPAVVAGEDGDFPSITAAELAEIDVPVRILHGEDDDVVSVENARQLAERLPRGDLVEFAGEDHSFMHDETRTVEATLTSLSDE